MFDAGSSECNNIAGNNADYDVKQSNLAWEHLGPRGKRDANTTFGSEARKTGKKTSLTS